jgi:hypothetical protein
MRHISPHDTLNIGADIALFKYSALKHAQKMSEC